MVETKTPIEKQKSLLGEQLLASGAITLPQLTIALQQQRRTGEMLGEILRKLGFLSSEGLSVALASQSGSEHIDLDQLEANPEYAAMVPEAMAREKHVVPVQLENGILTLAMANIYDMATISEIESRNNVIVQAVSSSLESMQRAIARIYELAGSIEQLIDACILRALAHIGESAEALQLAYCFAASDRKPPIYILNRNSSLYVHGLEWMECFSWGVRCHVPFIPP
jgi:type IV pilus assembly protein PilB